MGAPTSTHLRIFSRGDGHDRRHENEHRPPHHAARRAPTRCRPLLFSLFCLRLLFLIGSFRRAHRSILRWPPSAATLPSSSLLWAVQPSRLLRFSSTTGAQSARRRRKRSPLDARPEEMCRPATLRAPAPVPASLAPFHSNPPPRLTVPRRNEKDKRTVVTPRSQHCLHMNRSRRCTVTMPSWLSPYSYPTQRRRRASWVVRRRFVVVRALSPTTTTNCPT